VIMGGQEKSKHFESEFFTERWRSYSDPGTGARFDHRQEVLRALDNWSANARNVLQDCGYGDSPWELLDPTTLPDDARDARDVLFRCEDLRRTLSSAEKGLSADAVQSLYEVALVAVALGYTVTRAHVRPHEPNAVTGRKLRSAARKGKPQRMEDGQLASQHRDLYERLAKEVQGEHPLWGVTVVRDEVTKIVKEKHKGIPCSLRTLIRLKIPSR
jgi:hypothetical protein